MEEIVKIKMFKTKDRDEQSSWNYVSIIGYETQTNSLKGSFI